ncbi:hypothetical protein PWT90_03370 [Aphanocladium album]|nr:hypothetical protein PWT90_03370 [Aphanocladium album]
MLSPPRVLSGAMPSPELHDPASPLASINTNPYYYESGLAASAGDGNHPYTIILTEIMEEQEAVSLSSTFPNPPPFWKDFTADKVARYEQLRREHDGKEGEKPTDSDGFKPQIRINDLPEELIHLQPPAEPSNGRWRVFGDQYMLDDKLPTLEEQGITNLPASGQSSAKDAKHYDRAFELKRLSKSLLLNFLELSGALSRSPSHAEEKVQDLRTLFINMHHILNEYRPHQARESAIEMMQDHLDRTRTETLSIRTQVDKAKRVLEGLGSMGVAGSSAAVAAVAAATDAGTKQAAEQKEGVETANNVSVVSEKEKQIWLSLPRQHEPSTNRTTQSCVKLYATTTGEMRYGSPAVAGRLGKANTMDGRASGLVKVHEPVQAYK